MPYTLADVDRAERRILAACPTALVSRDDYDWALTVLDARKTRAYVVFRPPIEELGQAEIVGDVDAIIAALKARDRRP
jgi:hypothetical protein